MGKWIAVSLLAACSQSEPPTSPPTPTIVPAVTPTVAPAPAPDPCSAAELAKRGTVSAAMELRQCGIKGIDEYVSNESVAKVVGHPLTDKPGDTTFEVTTRERFDQVMRCDQAPKLDWKAQRVWIAIGLGMDVIQTVAQIDDGKTLTLVVRNSSRSGCGGKKSGLSYRANAVVVPADRKIEFLYCAIPNNCTGLEK